MSEATHWIGFANGNGEVQVGRRGDALLLCAQDTKGVRTTITLGPPATAGVEWLVAAIRAHFPEPAPAESPQAPKEVSSSIEHRALSGRTA